MMVMEKEELKRDDKGKFIGENRIWVNPKGYYMIWFEGKNKLLHEYIWEQYNNCKKPEGFEIHHKDGNKQNNSIENLELLTNSEHQRIHSGWIKDGEVFVSKVCSCCKKVLSLDKFYDRSKYGNGYSTPSAKCIECSKLSFKARKIGKEDEIREYNRLWYLKNRERILKKQKEKKN